jgi:hypothetical protein
MLCDGVKLTAFERAVEIVDDGYMPALGLGFEVVQGAQPLFSGVVEGDIWKLDVF